VYRISSLTRAEIVKILSLRLLPRLTEKTVYPLKARITGKPEVDFSMADQAEVSSIDHLTQDYNGP